MKHVVLATKILLAFLLLGIGIGVAAPKEKYENLQIFAKVLNLVQEYYVEEVDTKKLIYGGIKGMLNELDPHTNFLPPDIFQEFESETTGEFGGLGIEITVEGGILTILAPIEDTPAWKAGIHSGDKVVSIDGVSTKGFSLAEAAKKMKGRKGQKIRLGIFREGFERPRDFEIVRDIVKFKSVKVTDLEDGFVYIKLTSFIEKTGKDLEEAFAEHRRKYGATKGVILDFRNNPGGLLDQAIRISDLFLDEGTIVSTAGKGGKGKEVFEAKKEGGLPFFPVVVLINEYSASASEIVAGALQDNNRAIVIGQRSFGKGSVQSIVKLGDGSALKLTVARYYTPKGVSIQADGIKPDIVIDNVDSEAFQKSIVQKRVRREAELEGHLRGDKEKGQEGQAEKEFWFLDTGNGKAKMTPREELFKKDFQVLQAFNYLRSWDLFMKDKSGGEKKHEPPPKKG